MEKTITVQRMLWATVAFAEIGALGAFFLGGNGTVVHEMTGGQPILTGIELLMLAGLATYAALRKTPSKGLLGFIAALNGLLFVFLASRLTDGSISDLSRELIVVDLLVVLSLTVGLGMAIRAYNRTKRTSIPLAV